MVRKGPYSLRDQITTTKLDKLLLQTALVAGWIEKQSRNFLTTTIDESKRGRELRRTQAAALTALATNGGGIHGHRSNCYRGERGFWSLPFCFLVLPRTPRLPPCHLFPQRVTMECYPFALERFIFWVARRAFSILVIKAMGLFGILGICQCYPIKFWVTVRFGHFKHC